MNFENFIPLVIIVVVVLDASTLHESAQIVHSAARFTGKIQKLRLYIYLYGPFTEPKISSAQLKYLKYLLTVK